MDPSTSSNISTRTYIYLLPYPLPPNTPIPYSIHLPDQNPLNLPTTLFEPTSTLVLTSPNRTFVDLRFFKPRTPSESPLPNSSHQLEWAFAGTSTSTPIADHNASHPNSHWPGLTHSTWTHWLDSRYPVAAPNIPIDQGDMYPISSDLTLEVGAMFQPALGAVKSHEEMWRDIDAVSVATDPAGKKMCVVLRVRDDARGVRGVIVRLGQFCQGVVMKGGEVSVERWEFCRGDEKAGAEKEGGAGEGEEKWRRTARVGDMYLPCGVTWRAEVLSVGEKVGYFDYEWDVEEVWVWD